MVDCLVCLGFFVALLVAFGFSIRKFSASKAKNLWPKDTVVLHQIGRGPWAPSLSPFPIKLETYLRMAKIPYVNDHNGGMSSKGKTPWITYNGEDVADSQLAMDFLNGRLDVDLDGHLTSEQRALTTAFQTLVDEHLYWTMCAWTFGADLSELRALLPYRGPGGWLVTRLLSHRIRGQLWAQGTGRHTPQQTQALADRDLESLSNFLGDKKFLTGESPCQTDCAIFGHLVQIAYHMPSSPHRKSLNDKYQNLLEYCDRMKDEFWPDWDECISHNFTRTPTK